jgi:hypothetical protein
MYCRERIFDGSQRLELQRIMHKFTFVQVRVCMCLYMVCMFQHVVVCCCIYMYIYNIYIYIYIYMYAYIYTRIYIETKCLYQPTKPSNPSHPPPCQPACLVHRGGSCFLPSKMEKRRGSPAKYGADVFMRVFKWVIWDWEIRYKLVFWLEKWVLLQENDMHAVPVGPFYRLL